MTKGDRSISPDEEPDGTEREPGEIDLSPFPPPFPCGPAIEPEVLDSLEAAEGLGCAPPPRHVGCALGPGCGCIGLPLAVLAGVFVSSLVALLWVLSLGRVPASIIRMTQRLRRRPPQG